MIIDKLFPCIIILATWITQAPLESYYWLVYYSLKRMLEKYPNQKEQAVFDKIPTSKIYHIYRAIGDLGLVVLSMYILGFWVALFTNVTGMILYEFINTEMMHGDWKFLKTWPWKIGGLNIPYVRFPVWCMVLIINFFLMLKGILTGITIKGDFVIFYLVSTGLYLAFGLLERFTISKDGE